MVDVSIVIRTKNQREYLEQSLATIWQQETQYSFEVVIVDSGSPTEVLAWISKEIQDRPARLFQIKPEEFGFSYSLNHGIQEANGRFIICLSGDAVPADTHWLNNLVQPLEGSHVAGVYGRQIPRNKANFIERFKLFIRYSEITRIQKKSHIFSNANCAFKRILGIKYPFDESLPVCEDYDWARRVQRADFSIVYEPSAIVYHSHTTGIIGTVKRILSFRIWRFRIDYLRN